MRRCFKKLPWCAGAVAALLGLAGSAVRAEQPCLPPPRTPDCLTAPVYPPTNGVTGAEPVFQPGTEMASLPSRGGGAGIGSSAELDPGYIDSAVPRTMFRSRFDSFYRDNRPDRADFFYPKCGCFMTPDAKGPPLPEKKVDAQEQSFYFEYAPSQRFSGFFEVPIRFINPEVNANNWGVSDLNFGFKYAVIYSPEQVLSFQLRTFAPTGDPFKGLGTNNWNLEPAFLYERQLSDRLALLGELRDRIPIDPDDDFAGQVLRYGFGFSYLAYSGPRVRVTPIAEVVGWTVLHGKEFAPDIGVKDAAGDTIVNGKLGARFFFGDRCERGGLLNRSDLYLGYGRALTGTVWYKDVIRLEYRLLF